MGIDKVRIDEVGINLWLSDIFSFVKNLMHHHLHCDFRKAIFVACNYVWNVS